MCMYWLVSDGAGGGSGIGKGKRIQKWGMVVVFVVGERRERIRRE